MPIYDLKCNCGHEEQNVLSGYHEYPPCPKCGEPLQRVIGKHHIVPDLEPYLDPHLADKPVYVRSKKHREQLMREHGVYEKFGKGWR